MHAIPAPGSKFVKWAKSGGLGCLPTTAKYCSIYNAEGSEESWFVLAEFAAVPAPVVSSISPTEGPAAGGNSVTITGENFNAGGDAEEVLFGTEAASSFSVESNTEIVAEAPAGTAESTVHVTVVTPSGTSTETAADEYSYEGAAAAASTLEVIAEGSGSGEVSGVGGAETPPGAFEGTPPLECQWNGETEEQTGTCEGSEATVEEVAPGTFLEGVSVHAIPAPGSKFVKWAKSGGLGCLPTTAKYCSIYNAEGSEESWFVLAEFAAVPAPVVSSISPAEGPAAGGTPVTITGENFNAGGDAEEVLFGTEKAESFSVESDTKIVAEAPEGTAESTVHVTVVTPSGTSAETAADEYTYEGGGVSLTVNTGTGTGTGQVNCEVNGSSTDEPCEGQYAEGDELTLEAVADEGSEFVSFENATGSAETPCAGTPTTCTFTIEATTEIDAVFALEDIPFTVNESGEGSVECEDVTEGGGLGACAATYPYGHTVKAEASPETGWELESLTGSGSAAGECSGSVCEFTITEASEVSAVFALEDIPFTVNESGEGSVECEDVTEGGGLGACAATYPYGHTVKAEASPETGWELESLTGSGSAAGECSGSVCEFTITEASEVSAAFGLEGAATLHVFKGGNGQGTVTSLAPDSQIDCGAECEAEYAEGETIELEAEAQAGSVFAGWLGCHPVVGEEEKCHVTISGEEVDVTAVFLAEAVTPEINITSFSGNEHGCSTAASTSKSTEATATFATAKTGATDPTATRRRSPEFFGNEHGLSGRRLRHRPRRQPLLRVQRRNGPTRRTRQDGTDGERPRQPGADRPTGRRRPERRRWRQRPERRPMAPTARTAQTGPRGPQGPRGKQGKTGKVKVICKVKSKQKVVCKVRYVKSHKKHSKKNKRLSWRLMKRGHVMGHGRTSLRQLNRVIAHLRPGRYVLRVEGHRGGMRIAVGDYRRQHGGHRHG